MAVYEILEDTSYDHHLLGHDLKLRAQRSCTPNRIWVRLVRNLNRPVAVGNASDVEALKNTFLLTRKDLHSEPFHVHLINHGKRIEQDGEIYIRGVQLLASEADLDAMKRHQLRELQHVALIAPQTRRVVEQNTIEWAWAAFRSSFEFLESETVQFLCPGECLILLDVLRENLPALLFCKLTAGEQLSFDR